VDYVVRHDLTEKGDHNVECVVTYTDQEGKPQKLKKSWPFDVLEPVWMSYTVTAIPHQGSLVQITLQNCMTDTGICLESMDFQASPSLDCQPCGPCIPPAAAAQMELSTLHCTSSDAGAATQDTQDTQEKEETAAGLSPDSSLLGYFSPGDSIQVVYLLTPIT